MFLMLLTQVHSQSTPVTISSDTWDTITLEAFQRKTFFAHNRYWIFYAKGPETKYRTSIDGLTWSSPTLICPGGPYAGRFSLWFDGTYVHYARSARIPTESIMYRRGNPNSDGTITWSTPDEQTVISPSPLKIYEPFITVDSEGYPWIGYRWGINGEKYPNCTKSSLNNGTWQTTPGFPYQLSSFVGSDGNWAVSIVPLTQQKMYAVYLCAGLLRGKLWDGTVFKYEEFIAEASIAKRTRFAHSLVARENDVYLVFLNVSVTKRILFCRRTSGIGWSEQETIQASVNDTAFPVLSIDSSNGDLYCFWANNDVIYYKKHMEGSWDNNATTWVTEPNLREDSLTCYYQTWGSRIGVIWVRGEKTSYDVRFCSLITGTIHKLTITSTTGGTTDPHPGTYDYVEGSSVNVTAIPNSGYSFNYWLLDGEERTENPITIILDDNHTLGALFVDDIQPEISVVIQEPPENITAYQNVTIRVSVTDLGTGLNNVTLWYRIDNGTTWTPLNMTEISANTYQVTIPGYENCTWITYKIIAYDNAGNEAVNNNQEQYYIYHVIPEFPSLLILHLFMIATLLVVICYRRKRPRTIFSNALYLN